MRRRSLKRRIYSSAERPTDDTRNWSRGGRGGGGGGDDLARLDNCDDSADCGQAAGRDDREIDIVRVLLLDEWVCSSSGSTSLASCHL